jgi:D-galactarolactone cycloisomerase
MAIMSKEAIDIVQPDVAKTGGLTEVIKIAAPCAARGIEFAAQCALFGRAQVAPMHLSAAQRPLPLLEWLSCDIEGEIHGPATIPEHGWVRVPDDPRRRLDPDPAVVEEFRI